MPTIVWVVGSIALFLLASVVTVAVVLYYIGRASRTRAAQELASEIAPNVQPPRGGAKEPPPVRITFRNVPNDYVADYLECYWRYQIEPPPGAVTGSQSFFATGRVLSVTRPGRGTLVMNLQIGLLTTGLKSLLDDGHIGPVEGIDNFVVAVEPKPVPFEQIYGSGYPWYRGPTKVSAEKLRMLARRMKKGEKVTAELFAEAAVIESVRDEVREALRGYLPTCPEGRPRDAPVAPRDAGLAALAIWGTAADDEFLSGEIERTKGSARNASMARVAAHLPCTKLLPFLFHELETGDGWSGEYHRLFNNIGHAAAPRISERLAGASAGARAVYANRLREIGTPESIAAIKPFAKVATDKRESNALWGAWKALAFRSAFGPHEMPPYKRSN